MSIKDKAFSFIKRQLTEYIGRPDPLRHHPVPINPKLVFDEQRQRAPTKEQMLQTISSYAAPPLISIVMPVYNPPLPVFRQTLDCILAQAYPHWELCIANDHSTEPDIVPILREYQGRDERIRVEHLSENMGIAGASNKALSLAKGEYVCLVDSDDLILPDTLFEFAKHLHDQPEVDYLYSDSALIDMDNELCGYFYKSDFNLEMLLCHNWIGQLSAFRRSIVVEAGGWTPGLEGQDYDLFIRCVEKSRMIGHIHKILYLWRKSPASISVSPENKPRVQEDQRRIVQNYFDRHEINGTVIDIQPFMFRLRRPFQKKRVSFIVGFPASTSSEDSAALLQEQTRYPHIEILLLDHSKDMSLAQKINQAAAQATGDFLCFLFQEFDALSADWLESLLEQAQRPEVGMVGGKILNNVGRVETAGVVLSRQGPFSIYKGATSDERGYTNSLLALRSYQLISGNLAMISKELFNRVGGFDVRFSHSYFDYDLAMRLEQQGQMNLYTPFAVLQLKQPDNFYPDKTWSTKDFKYFQQKWESELGKDGNLNLAIQEKMLHVIEETRQIAYLKEIIKSFVKSTHL
ncbi:MAG: glycosyltransferase [SAR324 cluster bacterium]|nr:glycosyltransferase [SAR324 cluster bacterium]